MRINGILQRFALATALLGAAVRWLPVPSGAGAAFVAGEALFAAYCAVLVLVAQGLVRSRAEAAGARVPGALLLVGMVLKVFGVAAGVYLALVVWQLRADFFVGGSAAALAVFAVLIAAHHSTANKTLAPN